MYPPPKVLAKRTAPPPTTTALPLTPGQLFTQDPHAPVSEIQKYKHRNQKYHDRIFFKTPTLLLKISPNLDILCFKKKKTYYFKIYEISVTN